MEERPGSFFFFFFFFHQKKKMTRIMESLRMDNLNLFTIRYNFHLPPLRIIILHPCVVARGHLTHFPREIISHLPRKLMRTGMNRLLRRISPHPFLSISPIDLNRPSHDTVVHRASSIFSSRKDVGDVDPPRSKRTGRFVRSIFFQRKLAFPPRIDPFSPP